ncbi:Hypothetical protein CINCED_3A003624 [Cinara cedri]|uniref:Uncharacterized protein n=1 Tax=Cinara cedri TaxID=506608 RepID=A0A5E4MIR0_9HEMI|nr:Hypothetical protein CINCED_3A003624 [Cinara cedri]
MHTEENTENRNVGVFNMKIGKEKVFKPGQERLHQISKDSGIWLIMFAMSKGMLISSTFFPHRNIYKLTWISPIRITKNQIDHVVTNNIIKHRIQNVKSHRGMGFH